MAGSVAPFHVETEWAKSDSYATATVFSSGYFSFTSLKARSNMAGSFPTLRKAHGEILARPNLIAVSVKNRNCSPVSVASPSRFWRIPNTGSATLEQVGPSEKSTLSESASRRTTVSPSSALQASSYTDWTILTRLPWTITPPASLISSTARAERPLELLPMYAAGPLSAHIPPMRSVPSSWKAPAPPGARPTSQKRVTLLTTIFFIFASSFLESRRSGCPHCIPLSDHSTRSGLTSLAHSRPGTIRIDSVSKLPVALSRYFAP